MMAVNAPCMVNCLSVHRPGENVKGFEVLFACRSLSECIYISSTWLNITCKTGWGQPKLRSAKPLPLSQPFGSSWVYGHCVHEALSFQLSLLCPPLSEIRGLIGVGGALPPVASIHRFLKPEGTVLFLSPDLPHNTAH